MLDADAFVPEDIVILAQWVADYYACGAGDAIGAAVPPRALDRDPAVSVPHGSCRPSDRAGTRNQRRRANSPAS